MTTLCLIQKPVVEQLCTLLTVSQLESLFCCNKALLDTFSREKALLSPRMWLLSAKRNTYCCNGFCLCRSICDKIGRSGRLDVVKYVDQICVEMGETAQWQTVFDYACFEGHLPVAQWVYDRHKEDVQIFYYAMDNAAFRKMWDIVRWLHSQPESRCSSYAMDGAAFNGDLPGVQWLHENRTEGCTEGAMDCAAAAGHLHVVQWLHENRTEGCTNRALQNSSFNGHFRTTLWLWRNRREFAALNWTGTAWATWRVFNSFIIAGMNWMEYSTIQHNNFFNAGMNWLGYSMQD
jgi:hypothetical protein